MTSGGARTVLLIGGTSEIGVAIVRRLAADGPIRPFLLGRDREGLERALAELAGAGCHDGAVGTVDARDTSVHEQAVADAFATLGRCEIVVLAAGVLGAQAGLDADRDTAIEVMEVNFAGAGSLLLAALRALRAQGGGTLIVLSSAAVERPRASNAIYGAAKTGLDALAQGLADATRADGIRVLVVRPGFVRTKMTAGLPSAPLATTADAVAEATVKALAGSRGTIWCPPVLRPLFAILRPLPRSIWRRMPV